MFFINIVMLLIFFLNCFFCLLFNWNEFFFFFNWKLVLVLKWIWWGLLKCCRFFFFCWFFLCWFYLKVFVSCDLIFLWKELIFLFLFFGISIWILISFLVLLVLVVGWIGLVGNFVVEFVEIKIVFEGE